MTTKQDAMEAAVKVVAQAAEDASRHLSYQIAYDDEDRLRRDAAIDALDALTNALRAMLAARPTNGDS